MTNLSPAAQAVLDAAFPVYDEEEHLYIATGEQHAGMIAAALRAAADQMRYTDQLGLTGFGGYTQAQDQILAIATELEAQ